MISLKAPTKRSLVATLGNEFGITIPSVAVCVDHSAPLDFVTQWIYDRPGMSVVLGPRGGGKSFLSAFATHVDSYRRPHHATKILGGSLAQSEQIYNAIQTFEDVQPGEIATFTKTRAVYLSGSEVSMLAASAKSVRGPHVPTLRLDEIDEIDPDIRESSVGMCMDRNGVPASISMTSTWHRVGGPMAGLIERGQAGEFPYYSFCAFEVLERCPESRSGPNLEHCPECPIQRWCHDTNGGIPKAKRSNGHYAIDSLIQKVKTVSLRIFEADYLCKGPKADGVWFTTFDDQHISEDAEYNPRLPVHVGLDTGVSTGAVFYQVMPGADDDPPSISVFADYFAEGLYAEANAYAVMAVADTYCNGLMDICWTDPAGDARTAIGPKTIAEYERAGLRLTKWNRQGKQDRVADGLALIEGALLSVNGTRRIKIHPRCVNLISAFKSYRRKKIANQWMDRPEDPQHPAEDLMDSLRGGLVADSRGYPTWGAGP